MKLHIVPIYSRKFVMIEFQFFVSFRFHGMILLNYLRIYRSHVIKYYNFGLLNYYYVTLICNYSTVEVRVPTCENFDYTISFLPAC